MKIVNLTNNNEIIVKVDTEIGYKLALNPEIKGMFVYEDGNTYVALFNDGDTNWIEDAKTFELACQWLTGKIDSTELYEKNEEVIEIQRKKDIKIFSIEETGYEDGSYWVEYKIKGTKKTSIEIVNGDEEDTEEDIEKKFFEKSAEKLCNKINLEECSEKMQEVIHDCLMSENGTWFIDESDDMEKEELEQLIAEIEELGLCNCMVVDDEEGIEITIYGETITKFIY